MELTILTVAYHSQAPIEQLGADLARQSRLPQRWLVVDNAPDSNPLQITPPLAALPLKRISGVEGAGFGEGCNQGFQSLAAEGWQGWVWLLNPDASLGEPDLIERLEQLLAPLPPRALVGTAVWGADGNLEASGGWIDPGLPPPPAPGLPPGHRQLHPPKARLAQRLQPGPAALGPHATCPL